MTEFIGRQFENYRIDALLEAGSMGTVYRGQELKLERPIALKVMHRYLSMRPQFRVRFLQEIRTAAHLGDHPSIVDIYAFGAHQELLYIAMEFQAAASLGKHMRQAQRRNQLFKLSETLLILADVADALGYGHERAAIHGTLKPDHVLLKPLEEPRSAATLPLRAVVTDYGTAGLAEGDAQLVAAALAYMSPEQCLGNDLDGRSDLYALGTMLYELTTGQLPFDPRSPAKSVLKITSATVPEPQAIRPGIPSSVATIIRKSLTKDPNGRYQVAEEMANALREAAVSLPVADELRFGPPATVVSLEKQALA